MKAIFLSIIGLVIVLLSLVAGIALMGYGQSHADFSARLAGEYSLWRKSRNDISISPPVIYSGTPVIPGKVVACDFDKRFVIAKQQDLQRTGPGDPNDEPIGQGSGTYHFWILDASIPKVYGPLSESEFKSWRKSLGVPGNLRLRDVDRFRPWW